jgi:hypothetical protein
MGYPQKRVIAFLLCLVVVIAAFSSNTPIESNTQAQKHYASNRQSQNESAEQAIARYNWWLTLFTAILAVATVGLGGATVGLFFAGRNQLHLARDEFLSTHRPRMRLKAIWLASADGQTSDPELRVNEPLVVRLDVVYFGNTKAFIARLNLASVFVQRGGQLPQRPPYNEPTARGLDFHPPFELNRGVTFTQPISDGHILDALELNAVYQGNQILYFVGTIDYRDSIGNPMQTAFCRYLQFTPVPQDSGRFETAQNPHYEYQD